MERTKEQVAPSVATLTLDLDACLAAVAKFKQLESEDRLRREAAQEVERCAVDKAATAVASLVLARLPAALAELDSWVEVDACGWNDQGAHEGVGSRALAIQERVVALLNDHFKVGGEALVYWQHLSVWQFRVLRRSLIQIIEIRARKRAAAAPETPTDSTEQAQPEVTFAPSCDDENGGKTPQARYQRAVERLRALCGGDLSPHSRPFAEARAHLAEVLGEGIPGLIDLRDVRFCSDAPFDVLRAEGDIIDENGAALLRKGECFAVERGAAAEGDLARVKLQWWDESGTWRNEFALAMQPAAVVGECRDANLKDALATGRLK